jgi:CSLREA domain-containing protein
MYRLLSATGISLLWLALFVLSVFAQPEDQTVSLMPDLNSSLRQQQFTIPPLEPPTGATITVTTTADEWDDTGVCSLRQAIHAANTDTAVGNCPAGDGDDLILLPAGVYELTREGTGEDDNVTGDLDIRSSLVISGEGAEVTFIDANHIDRVLHVHADARVELRGLTLRNGQPGDGEPAGGIYNTGILTLTAVTVAYNIAGKSFSGNDGSGREIIGGPGGGIANKGVMTLIASIVMENHCGSLDIFGSPDAEQYGIGAAGGGIFSSGTMTIVNSSVLSNTAGVGGPYSKGGDGGGVASTGTLSIANSVITANRSGFGGWFPKGSAPGGDGGGIATSGIVTVTNSHIRANWAYGHGGGIFNAGIGRIVASEIDRNISGFRGDGGGIYNTKLLVIDSSTVSRNENGASGHGGGIFNNDILHIIQSTISGNQSGSAISYIYGIKFPGGDGGGIYNLNSLFVDSTTIAANATGKGIDEEGCELPQNSCTGGSGGGIASEGAVSIHNSLIAQNEAAVDATGPDCLGSINSYGHNLIGITSGCTLVGLISRDIYNQYAWLAPLADNGGPTPTHALLPQSPALNAGSCTTFDGSAITTDQRGEPRPQGAGCDIGAYESALEYAPPEALFLPVIAKNDE